MSRRGKRAAEIQEAIATVLLHDWDPIGVSDVPAAHDEYNSYVGGVYRLLSSGASEFEIIHHLIKLETTSMGLSAGSPEQLKDVARKLLELKVSL